jgi:hypothetical protein
LADEAEELLLELAAGDAGKTGIEEVTQSRRSVAPRMPPQQFAKHQQRAWLQHFRLVEGSLESVPI